MTDVCKTCEGDGLVELADEKLIEIRSYLEAQPGPRGPRYEDGEEISTMRMCPDCDGGAALGEDARV